MTVYEVPGLHPLELWQNIAGGRPLSQFQGRTSEYFQQLRDFLLRLHRGSAIAAGQQEIERFKQAVGFERVVLCGGGALDPAAAASLCDQALPFAVEIDMVGPFAGRRGALQIFRSMGWQRGAALDLGQLQLKVMTAQRTVVVPRDLSRLPLGANAIEASLGRQRLRELIEDGLSRMAGPQGEPGASPDGIVLALPVALGRDGAVEPATYPGLFGPVQSIFSGLFACPCVVLNDAVLAAIGFPPRAGEKTLVLTLGFGIGAALWAP